MQYGGNLAERSFDETSHPGLRLEVDAAPKTRPCPKCGARAALYATDCRRCGVNFARHRMALEMAAQARPVYVNLSADEKSHGILRNVTAPPKTTSSLPMMLFGVTVLAALAWALWG